MTKFRLLIVGIVATLGMAVAVSNASALTVTNPGTYVATFAAGGLTLSTAGGGAKCPATATIDISSTGATNITGFVINPNPCNGITITPLLPMTNQITGGAGSFTDVINANIGISAPGVSCLYTGTVNIPMTSGSTTLGRPSGGLTDPTCIIGPATVGGTGGTLNRAPIIR